MERRLVYDVREAPDRALAHAERVLERAGFSVSDGQEYDLVASRGADRIFVGLAPHRRGLVARVKGKGLLPGRSADLVEQAVAALSEQLGRPVARRGGEGRG